jgi:hypothetical protein
MGRGGLAKSDDEAARFYKPAADQGNAFAQYNLGHLYEAGRGGLPKDDREAARLYRLAADQGIAEAQNSLGRLYETGRGGLPKSDDEAERLRRAAGGSGPASVTAPAPPVAREASEVQGAAIVTMTPETIREARQLLYDRNYGIRGVEPEQGPDLRDAIKLLQKNLRQAVTGILTVPQLEALRKIPQPSLWGAIGYTGSGGHIGVTQRPTRARAEEDAEAECASKTVTIKRCKTLTVAGNRCVALVHSFYNNGIDKVAQTYVAYGDDPASVGQSALADCKANAQIRNNCEIRRTLCADGRN